MNQIGEGQNNAKYFDIAGHDEEAEEVQEGPTKRPKNDGWGKGEVGKPDERKIEADPKPSGFHATGDGSTSCLNTGHALCGPY